MTKNAIVLEMIVHMRACVRWVSFLRFDTFCRWEISMFEQAIFDKIFRKRCVLDIYLVEEMELSVWRNNRAGR